MVRPQRIDPEAGIHHVYTRGTNRWPIFMDDVDRRRFMGTLCRVCLRYEVEVLAYSLMDNHLHLLLRCPTAGLSDAMRDLKSIYARWFNTRHGFTGPNYEGRFGSKLVTSFRQLKNEIRYIHRNPYDIDRSMDLATYPWSSHALYLGQRPVPEFINVSIGRALFSDYRTEVETPRPTATDSSRDSGVVPGTAPLAPASIGPADILIAIAHAAGRDVAEVTPGRRNGLIGLAVIAALDHVGFSAHEIADPFGYRTVKAVQTAGQRARRCLSADATNRNVLDEAVARLIRNAA